MILIIEVWDGKLKSPSLLKQVCGRKDLNFVIPFIQCKMFVCPQPFSYISKVLTFSCLFKAILKVGNDFPSSAL